MMAAMSHPSADGNKGLESLDRPLSLQERELLIWLIEHSGSEDKPQLRSQAESLSVRKKCTCGCPTVYFALNGVPVNKKRERLIADYLATVDGQDVGVMLFESDGLLSSLEVYSCAGSDKPFGLPEIATLHTFEEHSKH
jgi:hypothetical protein